MNGQKVLCKAWTRLKGWGLEYQKPATLLQFNFQPDNGTTALVMLPDGTLAEYPFDCIKIVLEKA